MKTINSLIITPILVFTLMSLCGADLLYAYIGSVVAQVAMLFVAFILEDKKDGPIHKD